MNEILFAITVLSHCALKSKDGEKIPKNYKLCAQNKWQGREWDSFKLKLKEKLKKTQTIHSDSLKKKRSKRCFRDASFASIYRILLWIQLLFCASNQDYNSGKYIYLSGLSTDKYVQKYSTGLSANFKNFFRNIFFINIILEYQTRWIAMLLIVIKTTKSK